MSAIQAAFGGAELLDQFYGLFAFSYRRLGTPVFSKSYIKSLLEEFSKDWHETGGTKKLVEKLKNLKYEGFRYTNTHLKRIDADTIVIFDKKKIVVLK